MKPIKMTTIVIGKTGRRIDLGKNERLRESDMPPRNAYTGRRNNEKSSRPI